MRGFPCPGATDFELLRRLPGSHPICPHREFRFLRGIQRHRCLAGASAPRAILARLAPGLADFGTPGPPRVSGIDLAFVTRNESIARRA
jgi:hypothetical protein